MHIKWMESDDWKSLIYDETNQWNCEMIEYEEDGREEGTDYYRIIDLATGKEID